MKKILYVVLPVMALATSCKKDKIESIELNLGSVTLQFEHVWGKTDGGHETPQEFKYNHDYTHDATGEVVSISKVKYYVSNVKLKKTDGKWVSEPDSYHLIEAIDGVIPSFTIDSLPVADYTELQFYIGVDSAKNVSGVQSGDLSTANNMFWSWNSGYIFVKIEGESTSVPAPDGPDFIYHVGGFSGAKSAIQTVNSDFSGQLVSVAKNANSDVHFNVNLAEVWGGTYKLEDMYKVHMPGDMAVEISKNFKEAFHVHHIHN